MELLKFNHIDNCPQFYTATINNWKNLLKPDKYKVFLIESLQFLVSEKRVVIYAFVIMDNHIHLVWKPTTLFSLKHTQLSFMKFTAQRIKRNLENNHPDVLKVFRVDLKDRTYQFWKRNPLCVDLFDNKVMAEKINYIHNNPVKAGLCKEAIDYKYSSAKFYDELGDEFDFLTRFDEF